MAEEKWAAVEIGGCRRYCTMSQLPWLFEEAARFKALYLAKGAPQEMVEKAYTVVIVKENI